MFAISPRLPVGKLRRTFPRQKFRHKLYAFANSLAPRMMRLDPAFQKQIRIMPCFIAPALEA
jgi:hypothetical protein